MWRKLQEAIARNKIAVLSALGVVVLVMAVVVVVPMLRNQDDVPADNQQTEALLAENLPESSKDEAVEKPTDTAENNAGDDKKEEPEPTALPGDNVEPQSKPEEKTDKDKSFIDKIIDLFTGNKEENKEDEKDNKDDNVEDAGSSAPAQPSNTDRNVVLVSNGGTDLGQKTVAVGTPISSLPTPYKEGYIFVGWYYDEAGKQPVESDAIVSENMTLYASYAQEAPLETIESKTFASAQNVAPDFAITVVAEDKTLDAATVLAGIEATNLTDPDQQNFINVSGSNGTFTITGSNPFGESVNLLAEDGFAEGSTFRIKLTDSRLNFKDELESVREFNFTTDMEEVLNFSYKEDITFISTEDLKNITNEGETVETLSIALYTADSDGKIGPAELTKGTFEYTKGELAVGDIVTIYAGVRPDLRTLETPVEQCGDVAYVEITKRNGNVYSYKNAEAEDVIFKPDMLPVSVDADKDGDSDNHSITVDNKKFDYSADAYANIELDSQTTVDIGDFMMFYTGTFGEETGENAAELVGMFGKITKVTDNGDGTTTVTYADADWEEVQAAMDVFTSQTMSGADMLEGVDVENLEASIEQQAIDSGFAEEAAQYLASMALATENFTKLSENMHLEDYKVTLEDGTPVSPEELQLMDSSISVKCEMEDDYPKAKISIVPEHLGDVEGTGASEKGLSIELEVKAKITITKSGSENSIVITVSGKFVEEVGIDIGAKSKAIWKVWGIFPYIAEYRVTANIDLLNYTGIEVNATMVTKEADAEEDDKDGDAEEGEDIAELIKGLLEEKEEEGEDEDSEETSNKLVQRYSEMLQEEADYLKIVDVTIYEMEKMITPEMPILAVNFSVDFIVEMEACVSIGFDFEYMTGKRYTYAVDVFGRKVKCDTVVLQEEKYEFCFYTMGRLGIRAGIELEFNVGLFSTKLDSVGIQAAAGAYTKLWGYFYYELKYTASQGRSQNYCGAMLVEVGAFLEVGLNAQVLDGVLRKEFEVLDKEWPLWSAGNADSILDFSTAQEDMPNIKLKQYIRSAVIPDSTFRLTYLDLKEGKEKQAIYNDYFDENSAADDENRRNFIITMTNDKFTYDPQTNTISVNPADGDKKLEGEMIITWVKYPLSFTSKPIQRTISLYWDNLRDGYVIVPYTNGGTYIPIIVAKYEAKVNAPADPERPGYIFEGWYSDEALTIAYTFPETMPAQDANIYAKWSACTDTPYRVEHYRENLLSGQYDLFEAEDFKGTTDTYVTPEVKSYTGFKSPAKQEVKILPDGSAVLRYYYDLEWHTVTFDPGEAGGETVVYDLKYGGTVYAPGFAAAGYTFEGWDKEVEGTMGTSDVTYTALWSKKPDTSYRVEYYVQQTDGSYTLQHLIEDQGYTGASLAVADLRQLIVDTENNLTADEKYIKENSVAFESMTVKGVSCENAVVEASGKTIIKINYKRITHKATFDFGYGDKVVFSDVYYEGTITVPVVTRTGYSFKGWSTDGATVVTPVGTMGTSDVTYTALWTPNTYTVAFDKDNDAASGEMSSVKFVYDVPQELPENCFTVDDYAFAGWATQRTGGVEYADGASVSNLTAKNDETVILYAVWKPAEYSITYNNCENAENANPGTYTVESEAINLSAPVRAGYTFDGWYDSADFSGRALTTIPKGSSGNVTLYAKWTAIPITYKVEHYKEALDGSWVLADTDSLMGVIDIAVTPDVKAYTGFTNPEVQTVSIMGDGTTVVRYEYTRKEYTITLDAGEGSMPEGASSKITAKYGAAIILPTPMRTGYGFSGWYNGTVKFAENVMPAENLTLTASYIVGQYNYTINHYQQNVDGNGYTLFASVVSTATMNDEVTAEVGSYVGFTAPGEIKTIIIGADESANVVDYYYTRNQYTLTWDLAGGSAADAYTSGKVYYGAAITAPVPVKTGYTYSWDKALVSEMPAEDITYTAAWTVNTYSVMFNVNGGSVAAGSTETRTVTYDGAYGELATLTKKGYTFDGWFTAAEGGTEVTAETIVTTAANHTLYAQFTPVTYTITYNGVDGASHSNPDTYSAETGAITLVAATKTGYTFAGWYAAADFDGSEVKVIPADSAENKVLYAKWEENTYKVIFHSNNGNDTTSSQSFNYSESKALDVNSFTKDGYIFGGWAVEAASTTVKYTDGQTVSGLSPEADSEIHLYAIWKLQSFAIVYENMDGLENADDNPTSFNEQNNVITLHDPKERTGYSFGGWYTDAALTNPIIGSLTLADYRTWTFYAKWTPNPYTITFDSCLGDTVPTETLLMTYDEAKNLTLLEDIASFERPGYTFKGWSTTKGGEAQYTDGQNVINLAAQGNVDLYAVWELNVFTITYDVGTGTVSHTNPATYSIEDDDVVFTAPVAKDGYQFLGWYEGDTLVKEIVKGTQRDYALTAKWAHGGEFSIAYTSSTSKDYGYELTYTVTRTLPEGTVATTNPQQVYYRTVNGTAYGSTAGYDANNDSYHFGHVGGENVFLTFNQTDFTKTFVVQDWGAYAGTDMAACFNIAGTNRYFNVELYKIVDTVGGCQGSLGAEKSVRRTVGAMAGYNLIGTLYDWKTGTVASGEVTVTDGGYSSNTSYTTKPLSVLGLEYRQQLYAEKTATGVGFYVTFDLMEVDDGYQWTRFSVNGTAKGEYRFATKDGEEASNWGRNITLPTTGAAQGDILFNVGDCLVSNSWSVVSGTTPYAVVGLSDTIKIEFDASGKNDDDWKHRNLNAYYKVLDTRAPQQVGIAPMALTQYKAGETISITVIYDEVIKSIADVGLNTISGLPIDNVQYVGGVGTNALNFTATVTSDFENTPELNNSLVTLKPVTGTVSDFLGN